MEDVTGIVIDSLSNEEWGLVIEELGTRFPDNEYHPSLGDTLAAIRAAGIPLERVHFVGLSAPSEGGNDAMGV